MRAPLLQDWTCYFNGQHVAVVVAETLEQADAAAAQVRVQYRRDEPVTLDGCGARPGLSAEKFSQWRAAARFRSAAIPMRRSPTRRSSVDATYITPMEHHNPMEPHATIARWDGDRLTVWTATQGISGAQQTLAALFGIDPAECARDLPLCRRRLRLQGQHLAAGDARRDGSEGRRPTGEAGGDARADVHLERLSPAHRAEAALRGRRQGHLVSMRHDGFSQMSQPALGEFAEPVGLATEMLYACPNVAVTHRLVATQRSLPTYMRAPGLASGNFALESAIDELAVALRHGPAGLPHAQLRRERIRTRTSRSPARRCANAIAQGAEAFGWSRRSHEPRSMRDGNVLIGWGMATSTYPTHRMPASRACAGRCERHGAGAGRARRILAPAPIR